jgi:DNA repair exonuclease SbcCD ATPase subunit
MIFFRKLRWKNFLSTGNIFTELNLDKHNTTLIVGENGAGKSTILDALSYALFSKPFRKVNKGQLVNTITRKDCVVEIEFSIGQNNYKIVRGMKPNLFEVYQNGTLVNQSAEMKDYQEILEKQILKINHKSFCQVVVLGSATFQPFMQLPTGQRREIIEDLLDLQIFTTMNTLLKNKTTLNKEMIADVNSDQRVAREKMKLMREHMMEMQNSNDKIIEEKRERIESTIEDIHQISRQVSIMSQELLELEDLISDEEVVSKKMRKLDGLRHQIEANKKLLKSEVEFFSNHDNCPTCKQTIDEQFKCQTVDQKNQQICEIEEGLIKLSEQYDELKNKIDEMMEVHSEINSKKMDVHQLTSRVNSLNDYKSQLEDEIKSIKKDFKAQDENKIQELESELARLEEELKELEDDRTVLTAASVLLKDGGIKSKIIRQYVPIINKLINKYLSAMDFFVQFELDEEFNETIKSRFRDEFSYASFSEGEKMRINLAILFTWRAVAKLRNSINTNLLIMDEVFDSSLDSNGTEEFMKILNQLTTDTNTFIISHKGDQLVDKFGNVIKFEKHKNFSRIAS